MHPSATLAAASTSWGEHLRSVGECGSLSRLDSTASLDLSPADPAALAALLAGRPVRLRSLVRDRVDHAAALRRARSIRDNARDLVEQHGVDAGQLALGIATWTAPNSEPRVSPVLLRPLRLVARTASEDDFELSLGPATVLNPGLAGELFDTYGVTLDLPPGAEVMLGGGEPVELFEQLRRAAAPVPHFEITASLVLGTYTEAAVALARDLDDSVAAADAPILAALAGDGAAAEAVRGEPLLPDFGVADRLDPGVEFLALDADAPASAAIAAALSGRHLAIEGGPGTGLTQTAVNLIAALVAAGRTVLVLVENRKVAEKVLARLASAGLAELAIDAAAAESGRQRIAGVVAAAAHPLPPPPDSTRLHERVTQTRDRLRAHAESMHAVREPWGISVYSAQAQLLGLPGDAASRIRFPADVLAALHGTTLAEVRDAVREWSALGGTTLTGLDTPWFGARVGTGAAAGEAQRLATALATDTYPAARAVLERTMAQAGLAPVASVADWRRTLDLLRAVADTDRLLSPEVWTSSLPELIAATADAGWRREQSDRQGWQDRVTARRAARRLWRSEKPVGSELHDALVRAADQLAEWSRAALRGGVDPDGSGPRPQLPRPGLDLDGAEKAYAALLDGLAALQLVLPDRDFPRLAPAVLDKTLHGLANDPVLHRLPRLGELSARCSELGLRPFLLDLHTRRLAPELAPTAFTHAWLSSILQSVAGADPALGAFDGDALRGTLASYQQADRAHLASTGARVRHRARAAGAEAVRAHPEQAATVRTEVGPGGDGRAALRRLLQDAPDVALAAAPCWVMSPYAVPELLPPTPLFDLVIVPGANAVSVPVGAAGLARARQVVLLGDRRQLPPMGLDDTTATPGADVSAHGPPTALGLLGALAPMLPLMTLTTCVRPTDERLVSFAAATVYGGRLRTTPSPDRRDRLTHVPVPHRSGTPGQEDSVTAEVQKVVGLVIDAAVRCPDTTMGVVTLADRHAERIAAALRVALVGRPELGDVFRGDAAEPFFVKPASRLAGEVRDRIVFSTGFGKTPEGRSSYRFGALGAPGGERLITVAMTRARDRITVVSSFASTDLDPARLPAAGPRLLRALLRYAEVPELRETPYAEPPPPDGLDLDLRARLRAAGLPVVADYGLGVQRVALALSSPDDPDRLVLAIETDGTRWAERATVRDRDRLHEQHLAGLGWAVHRVFATDWVRNPAAEVDRIRGIYHTLLGPARQLANRPDSGGLPPLLVEADES